ncbi:putative oxidoreductase YciK [Thalassocella blandensis]|nr:putative oxidoreductase YciK [Thalassocella blandensis]
MTSITDTFLHYQAPEKLLQDKIILVTGAGDGIGKVAALSFAQHGATVVLLGRTLSKLERVYDEIESLGGPQPAIFPMNLEGAGEHEYQAMHDTLNEEFGRLDGILFNAAQLGPRTPIANYAFSEWQKVLQVNVTSPFLMVKSMLPLLNQSQSASILFTGSSVGRTGRAYWGGYAVSKAATENLMQILADEYESSSHIRVNSINPGAVRTKMRATAYPAENPGTVTDPHSIMNRYLYLMGDDSRAVNGQQFDAQPKA